ncbi:MAG: 4-demethylwyosine synthase TYW1 [Candidatus Pacearchaeota archaeon]|nr:MAG: 4-demethylwyosine synthase TYW1 [Candidatus Pacearchaeota archaeon]
MIPEKVRDLFRKQHYALVGNHSAVQICRWTKKSLLDKDVCYKQKFYGIQCHRCCQMAPCISWCQHRCVFCWRAIEYTLGDKMQGKIDDPKEIIDKCIEAQKKQLIGFMGNSKANKIKLQEAFHPKHFAISLAGEPTIYPKLSELIKELHRRKITTFLVTNGMLPEVLGKIEMPTQLYVSVDAPNEELYKKIDKPVTGKWKNLIETLKLLPRLKTRTVMRITCIRNLNMIEPENYAKFIKMAEPMFVEIKGYVAVGFSRKRLGVNFMPQHSEVRGFAEKISKHSGYKIIDEKENSRVVLLMKEDRNRFIKLNE